MIFLEVDPSVVRPGWTALFITLGLAVAMALLMISMRRQMRKIDAPYRDELTDQKSADADPESDDTESNDTASDDTEAKESQPEKGVTNGS